MHTVSTDAIRTCADAVQSSFSLGVLAGLLLALIGYYALSIWQDGR